jgi:hypothetical protein
LMRLPTNLALGRAPRTASDRRATRCGDDHSHVEFGGRLGWRVRGRGPRTWRVMPVDALSRQHTKARLTRARASPRPQQRGEQNHHGAASWCDVPPSRPRRRAIGPSEAWLCSACGDDRAPRRRLLVVARRRVGPPCWGNFFPLGSPLNLGVSANNWRCVTGNGADLISTSLTLHFDDRDLLRRRRPVRP